MLLSGEHIMIILVYNACGVIPCT